MQAITYHQYGSSEVLRCEEVEKPEPADDQVLLRVCAASVNPLDWRFMRGNPFFLRLFLGLRKPRAGRPGVDVAGIVEAIGRNVKNFRSGEAVFGTGKGAFAEYACALEAKLAHKPDNLTFEQAAALPIAGITALQGLRDKGKLQPGQKALVNGAAGGCGTYAVQIAKWMGAEVTGVCSSRNVEMVRSLGADQVIDYTKEDFTHRPERHDVIFDCVANHSPSAYKRVLTPRGVYVGIGGPHDITFFGLLAGMLSTRFVSLFASQRFVTLLAKTNRKDLEALAALSAAGTIRPVIERSYPLNAGREAVGHVEAGHARGKVLVIPD